MRHPPVHEVSDAMVFSTRTRWIVVGIAAVGGLAMVALSGRVSGGTHPYTLAHALAAVPYVLGALVLTGLTLGACAPEYRPFWRRAFVAYVAAALVTVAVVAGAHMEEPALYTVGGAIFLGELAVWGSAALLIVRAEAGLLSPSVDLIDAAMALAVLGAPGALLTVEPLQESDQAIFAAPLALAAVLTPAAVYLALVSIPRIPRGERATQAIGAAFPAAVTVALTVHLARLLADLDWPVPLSMGVHVVAMSLFMALPLWAHRRRTEVLGAPPGEGRTRAVSPVPYLAAATLPPLALYVFLTEDQRSWGVPLVVAALLAVVALHAVRYRLMSREARRLQDGLARMAEERRRLLADMVRALEDDRSRTATELHAQVVGSLATLGSMIQTAHLALPADAASAVKKTFADLQDDLREREELLRQMMLAMRAPALRGRAGTEARSRTGEDPLAAALLAYASELYQGPSSARVQVEISPELDLDWTMATIAYRVAQEALLNAARHAEARTVTVRVTAEAGGITLEVADDGCGFDPEVTEKGTGFETMRLFTNLGRGELSIRSTPGEGTLVRSRLAVRPEREGDGRAEAAPGAGPGRHLQLVPPIGADPEPHV